MWDPLRLFSNLHGLYWIGLEKKNPRMRNISQNLRSEPVQNKFKMLQRKVEILQPFFFDPFLINMTRSKLQSDPVRLKWKCGKQSSYCMLLNKTDSLKNKNIQSYASGLIRIKTKFPS